MAKMNRIDAQAKPLPPPATPTSPDLVDRIFEMLVEVSPEIAARAAELQMAVREEFGCERGVYVRSVRELKRQQLVSDVLRLFNGRNATEVARRLGIGRATVYRIIKQPGGKR